MANLTYNSPYSNGSDAAFRAWGKDLSDAFQACGLVKTADSGQINWATVPRAGANSVAGYEVYYLNDSAHATAPLYLKFEYGTGSNLQRTRLNIRVGKGSDGAGNLIGVFFSIDQTTGNNEPQGDSYPTYVCVADGAFWFAFKVGGITSSRVNHFLFLARSVGADGEPSGESVTLLYRSNGNDQTSQAPPYAVYRYSDGQELAGYATLSNYTLSAVWGGVGSSLVESSPQVYKHYTLTPRVRPNPYLLTVLPTEIGVNSQFEAQVIAGKTRTYISLPGNAMGSPTVTPSPSYVAAPVWE